MDLYCEQRLEAKIGRQKEEITRLLKENAKLKSVRAKGQEEAWELAQKIILPQSRGGMNDEDYKGVFGSSLVDGVIVNHTYAEAAAKVAEWERKKEEICVGDVVRFKSNNSVEFCVTNILDDRFLYGVSAEGDVYADRNIKLFEKTGRHIDVASMLAQIGGDCNE